MELRTLGSSGVSISRVGLGGFELGPETDEEPNIDRAVHVIEAAVEAGINWLDTSENYLETRNESLIGAALDRIDADFLLATKVAPGAGVTGGGTGFQREQVHQACRNSLRRLGRDQIDVYFLHWPDRTGVPLEETWGAMAELVDAGLVRAIGMSNYDVEDIERCHEQRVVDVVQDGLSLIDYLHHRASIARCGELGIGVTVFEPLAGGVLSEKTQEEVLAVWSAWVEEPFYKRLLSPGKVERSFAVADGVRPIAERLGATVAQVAIAWLLHQPGVTAAIAGSGKGRHVRENAEAANLDLEGALGELEPLIPLGPTVATF
jgi:myo-inositol catabolism protein IolS